MINFPNPKNQGFTLFVAIVVMGTLLLISTGVINLAVKQALISSSGKESQLAFYAADTGMECALYWDVKNSSGHSAFATSTSATINCNKDSSNSSNQWVVGGSSVSTINRITFLPSPACAIVTVTKNADNTTKIESFGYNTCDSTNPRRVERAVRATYGGGSTQSGPHLLAVPGSVTTNSTVTVFFSGITAPTATDWIGMYNPSSGADNTYSDWKYANSCTRTAGSSSLTSGSCTFTVTTAGTYNFRIFSNNGYTKLSTSNNITVGP